jgi:hypothetical protein
LQFSRGADIVDNRLRTLRLKPASSGRLRTWLKLAIADWRPNIAFVCVQSLDMAGDRARAMVLHWLDKRIGALQQLIG